jgi:hypothetical protein
MKTLLALSLFSGIAFGQLTTISQYVANADGTPFNGEVTIQVPPFASRSYAVRSRDIWLCSSANIITGCAQQIVNGVLTVQLLPNGGGSPAGTSYFVSYYPDVPPGRRPSIKTEYWVVPTGGPYTIDQVKTSTPPVPTVQISPTQLNPTGYTTGQFPCVVGGTFLPCSSAGGVWGSITGTLSNQTDLQTALNGKAATGNGWLFVTTDPTGTCTVGTQMRYNSNTGKIWGCYAGFWSKPNMEKLPTNQLTTATNSVTGAIGRYAMTTNENGPFPDGGCWMLAHDGSGLGVSFDYTMDCLWFEDGYAIMGTGGNMHGAGYLVVGDAAQLYPAGTGTVLANLVTLKAGAQPSCTVSNRGQQWFVAGAAGVKDSFAICAKDAGDAYAWRSIY